MIRYKKITENEVLRKYHEIQGKLNKIGCWCDYISINFLAKELNTSEYQVRKAYKSLLEKGYMKLEKYPSYCEEYDNGLYTQDIPILYTKVYVLTDKARELLNKNQCKDQCKELMKLRESLKLK